jgi:hypothetical protein
MESVVHRILLRPQPPNLNYRVDVLVDDNFIQITHHYETEQLSWTEITDGESNVDL